MTVTIMYDRLETAIRCSVRIGALRLSGTAWQCYVLLGSIVVSNSQSVSNLRLYWLILPCSLSAQGVYEGLQSLLMLSRKQ